MSIILRPLRSTEQNGLADYRHYFLGAVSDTDGEEFGEAFQALPALCQQGTEPTWSPERLPQEGVS